MCCERDRIPFIRMVSKRQRNSDQIRELLKKLRESLGLLAVSCGMASVAQLVYRSGKSGKMGTLVYLTLSLMSNKWETMIPESNAQL